MGRGRPIELYRIGGKGGKKEEGIVRLLRRGPECLGGNGTSQLSSAMCVEFCEIVMTNCQKSYVLETCSSYSGYGGGDANRITPVRRTKGPSLSLSGLDSVMVVSSSSSSVLSDSIERYK